MHPRDIEDVLASPGSSPAPGAGPPEDLLRAAPSWPVRVEAADVDGIGARLVVVEASVHDQTLASPRILGLPDAAVREAYHRVHTAFRSLSWQFPRGQVVVNLAPASSRKAGSSFDLAIALTLASLAGKIDAALLRDGLYVGELGLDGSLRPVRGILPILEMCIARGVPRLFCPEDNAALAARIGGPCEIVPVASLGEALAVSCGKDARAPRSLVGSAARRRSLEVPDLARVRGQESAREALILAAVGGHHCLFSGPPGCGKTLLARCLPGILPALPRPQRLELARIHDAFASLDEERLLRILEDGERPLRAPHHTVSFAGLVGGGMPLRPGEITRAHRGVLFLDELPEFARSTLEALRQPLEEGSIDLRRANEGMRMPARFQLIVAMNPCPCGMLGHPKIPCRDTPKQVAAYRGRISGPLLDRIDIQVSLHAIDTRVLLEEREDAPCSQEIRARVTALRAHALERNEGKLNAELDERVLRRQLEPSARALLLSDERRDALSARALVRVLRVARSAADMAGSVRIDAEAIALALHYRMRLS